MADVESQLAVRMDLRSGVMRMWTGRGELMVPETRTTAEGGVREIGAFAGAGSTPVRVRALEAFGSTLWAGSWDGSSRVWSVDTDTGAATAVGSDTRDSLNSLFELGGQRYGVGNTFVKPYTSAGVGSQNQTIPNLPARSRIIASAVLAGSVYMFIQERSAGTRAWYKVDLSSGVWSQARIAEVALENNVEGATTLGSEVIVANRRRGLNEYGVLDVDTGAMTPRFTSPTPAQGARGLAVLDGKVYAASQTTLYEVTFPATATDPMAYQGAAGVLEVTMPDVREEDGTQRATVAVASDEALWKRSQGPIPVVIREVTRAPGGDWTPAPLVWNGVLGESSVQGNVYRASIVPVADSALHRANVPEWSSLNQLHRTGGGDTSFSRLRSTGRALPFPARRVR